MTKKRGDQYLFDFRYMTWPLGMLFKRYDFRVQYLNPVMINMRDTGIIDHYFNQWKSPKNMKEHVEYVEEPLLINHFLVSGIGWSAGLTLSLFLFMKELLAQSGGKET